MIDARINGDSLEVEATGMDYWPFMLHNTRLATRLDVRLPLEHITAARSAPPPDHFVARHLNERGGGRGNRRGSLVWCRPGVPLLVLQMDGQPYGHVMLSVPDPDRLAEQIRTAAGVRELP
jgi:hypothetical protein